MVTVHSLHSYLNLLFKRIIVMAKAKILVQDIADALNLSRTTVSKVLNNSGSVSPQTRERVLHKAAELNYKCYSLIQPVLTENLDLEEAFTAQSTDDPEEESAPFQQSQIAVFFSKGIDKQHIGFNLLSVLGQELSRKNYSISMYFIQEAEFQSLLLPPTFHLEQTASILCIELLDKAYSQMLCSLGKPILFFDAYAGILEDNLPADVLTAESQFRLTGLIKNLIQKYHLQKIGFFGSSLHCLSFFERWLGFRAAILSCGLEYDETCSIIVENDDLYWDDRWLLTQLKRMDSLPELFVCANDALACQLVRILESLNIHCPRDILITGFDNSPISSTNQPGITTIDPHSSDLAWEATSLILSRLEEPEQPYRNIRLQSSLIERDSTLRR